MNEDFYGENLLDIFICALVLGTLSFYGKDLDVFFFMFAINSNMNYDYFSFFLID